MKKMLFIAILTVLGMVNYVSAEEPPKLKDFAYGFELDADGSNAIYKVALPEDVYRYSTRKDLGDLRVFNGKGEIVPHSLQHLKQKRSLTSASVALPIFPLYDIQIEQEDGYSMRIKTDDHGTIINIDNGKIDRTDQLQAYIIDASKLSQPPDKFVLAWSGDTGGSFTTTVSVLYSDDLNNWFSIVTKANISKLTYKNHELGNNTIHLPQKRAKYYKLIWPAGRDGVSLDSLFAQFNVSKIHHNLKWKDVSVSFTQKDPIVYKYDAMASLPVEKINVVFPYKNILLDAIIRSRSSFSKEWRVRSRGLLYSMEIDGQTLANEQINIPPTADRYWSLETSSIEGKLKQPPRLQLGWVPHDLYFVAQGDPPFKLAYGSVNVPPPPISTNVFFRNIDKEQSNATTPSKGGIVYGDQGIGKGGSIQFSHGYSINRVSAKSAKIMKNIQLGGDIMLKPKVVLPWKRWLLWSVLVAGVGVLAWMAFNLNKQLKIK